MPHSTEQHMSMAGVGEVVMRELEGRMQSTTGYKLVFHNWHRLTPRLPANSLVAGTQNYPYRPAAVWHIPVARFNYPFAHNKTKETIANFSQIALPVDGVS